MGWLPPARSIARCRLASSPFSVLQAITANSLDKIYGVPLSARVHSPTISFQNTCNIPNQLPHSTDGIFLVSPQPKHLHPLPHIMISSQTTCYIHIPIPCYKVTLKVFPRNIEEVDARDKKVVFTLGRNGCH